MEKEYISGLGKESELPPELKGWNWGAFLMNWIWGIGNSTYIALLMFVPVVNLVMLFVLGAKGNKWAWQNRIWRDVEHFKRVQRKWALSGLVIIFIVIPLFIFSITAMLKGEAYELAVNEISQNSEVIEYLGSPITPSFFVAGEISYSSDSGEASLGFSIEGPKQEADVFVHALKEQGVWVLKEIVVYNQQDNVQIIVID